MGAACGHVPVEVIITSPCPSHVSDSLWIANCKNTVHQNPVFFICNYSCFWDELRHGINIPLMEEKSME